MIRYHRLSVLTCVLCLAAALGSAQEQITEKDMVNTLNGQPRISASGHPVGVALHIAFSPYTAGEDGANRMPSGGYLQADNALYRAIIPLARALEAEGRVGSRYVIRLSPNSSMPAEQANRMGQQLSDTVAHFLMTYFAIPRERVSLQVVLPSSVAEGATSPVSGPQRWRLEVIRQD